MVAGLLVWASARAQDANTPDKDPAEKPYASIVARNMFGLLPIPPPDTNPAAAPVDPPPKIMLNGIMTVFGKDQALFKVEVKQPKQGQPKEVSYVLSEGEREDNIEVTKIDLPNRLVTFNNHGTVQEVTLEDAGSGTSSGGSAGGGPGGGAAPRYRPGGPISVADRIAMIRQRQAERANANLASPTKGRINGFQSTYNQQPQQNIEDQVMSVAKQNGGN